jgi:hypothetical protein
MVLNYSASNINKYWRIPQCVAGRLLPFTLHFQPSNIATINTRYKITAKHAHFETSTGKLVGYFGKTSR